MHKPVTTLKTNQNEWTAKYVLGQWSHYLQEHDRSAGTIKKYTPVFAHLSADQSAHF